MTTSDARVIAADHPDTVSAAATILRDGGLVAVPTETVYGLAASATNVFAVGKVFDAKERPREQPLSVLVADVETARTLVDIPEGDGRFDALADAFWPGPLTIVTRRTELVPDVVTSGGNTVGVRIPDVLITRHILQVAGPAAAPSANRTGDISPTRADHVLSQLERHVDLVVDGGPCELGLESTIVEIEQDRVRVLRLGGLPIEEIEAVVGPVEVAGERGSKASPIELRVLPEGELDPHVDRALLVITGSAPAGAERYGAIIELSPEGDLDHAGKHLFESLRTLYEMGMRVADVVPCTEEGRGASIMARIRKYAE